MPETSTNKEFLKFQIQTTYLDRFISYTAYSILISQTGACRVAFCGPTYVYVLVHAFVCLLDVSLEINFRCLSFGGQIVAWSFLCLALFFAAGSLVAIGCFSCWIGVCLACRFPVLLFCSA